MRRSFALLALLAVLAGCASPPPAPPPRPPGPQAQIADTSVGGGSSGAAFFFVETVNGKPVGNTNLAASRMASQGQGPNMRTVGVERYVPAGTAKLKLVARYAHAAPIQSLFSASASWSAEGYVDVELRDNVRYQVAGVLDAFRREVWLEEISTGTIVGQKVSALAAKPAGAAAQGGLFTCCNLHYEGDWISDANYAGLPLIPAGSTVQVKEYGRQRAFVEIEGRPMRIGLDFGREQDTIEKFMGRLAVKTDPRDRLKTYPAPVQAAILAGKLRLGMNKEQAIMSLGYPRLDKTKSLDAAEWAYSTYEDEEYLLIWGPDQTLKSVDAARKVRQLMVVE